MVAEHALDRRRLDLVVEVGAGAVRVDVADLLGRDAAVPQRHAHRARRTVGVLVRRGDVVGIVGRAVAEHLAQDRRAAALGVFVLLEHQGGSAFAHHEAVAVAVERPRGALGIVVATRYRLQRAEAGEPQFGRRGLRAARDHDVGFAPLDGAQREADRVARTRAGRRRDVAGALQAEPDRGLAGHGVRHDLRDEERADAVGATFDLQHLAGFDLVDAADAGAEDAAGQRAVLLAHVEPGRAFIASAAATR